MPELDQPPKLAKILTSVDVIWTGVLLLALIIYLVARALYLAWR